ncbi:hypothetical protein NUU61_001313 [Penicillium alfredii]|uniref:Uncharacterized protein n=1 Tax=Penicillium alfredii TaxID=1506179 RepID=A0A9W9G431_9EURO|nr:uncharacterized protein NUU61_001313 [Penicillium alfredii]KAJ5111683.1 hypothetical protein NUU61_001313 [Penicillium alfredii]
MGKMLNTYRLYHAFYVALRDAYDARKEEEGEIKPDVPLKANQDIHLTKMRRMAKELDGQVPCEPCKDADDKAGCCREENYGRCDNFDFFNPLYVDEAEAEADLVTTTASDDIEV